MDCETGRFVEVNPAAVRIYGYSREEFLALKVSDISAEPESSRGAIQRGETSVALRWHHRRDGTLFPVEIAGGYLEWSGRRMHVAAIRDISERKRAEAALQESEQRFAAVIRNSPVAIGISRLADGVFLEVNQAFADLHGYAREELVGHTSLELGLWHSGNREEVLRNLRQHKGRQIVEMQGRRKDGEIRCLLASIDSVQVGGELCMVGFLSDITERKQMEKALRESEEHYRLATGAARVALWRMDLLKGQFETDGALERMLGYEPGELGTDPTRWRAIVHPEDRERTNRLWQQASGGESKRYDCDYRVFHKDGSVRWVQVLGHALCDGLGRTVGLTGTTLDITAHKQLEAERTAALARLAVVEEQERHRLSRELHDQTAQRLVALAVELKTLETNLAAGRPQGERVRSLRQAVDDLQQQVHRIAWDLRAGELVEFGLERSLREYIEEWSERAQVPVDCAFRGLNGERLSTALEATVYRVAQEALANVEKHAQGRRVNVLLEREAALVRLIVEDDGCGFDVDVTHGAPDDTPRLGLLGMRERVKLAGGTLLVESSPGSGTTILVRIPVVADAAPS